MTCLAISLFKKDKTKKFRMSWNAVDYHTLATLRIGCIWNTYYISTSERSISNSYVVELSDICTYIRIEHEDSEKERTQMEQQIMNNEINCELIEKWFLNHFGCHVDDDFSTLEKRETAKEKGGEREIDFISLTCMHAHTCLNFTLWDEMRYVCKRLKLFRFI